MSEIKNPSVFPVGEPLPEQFSRFFIGQAYLNPLTQTGGPVANVTFEPGCRNNWHIHHKGGKSCWSPAEKAGIRPGANRPRNCAPAMW